MAAPRASLQHGVPVSSEAPDNGTHDSAQGHPASDLHSKNLSVEAVMSCGWASIALAKSSNIPGKINSQINEAELFFSPGCGYCSLYDYIDLLYCYPCIPFQYIHHIHQTLLYCNPLRNSHSEEVPQQLLNIEIPASPTWNIMLGGQTGFTTEEPIAVLSVC